MSEQNQHPIPDPEAQAEAANEASRVSLGGIRQLIREKVAAHKTNTIDRRVERAEQRVEDADHEVRYMGGVALITEGIEDAGTNGHENLPLVEYDALGRTRVDDRENRRKDFPPEQIPHTHQKHTLASHIDTTNRRMQGVYREVGRITPLVDEHGDMDLDDPIHPNNIEEFGRKLATIEGYSLEDWQEERQKNKREREESSINDQRVIDTMDRENVIQPRTWRERRAEKRATKVSRKIREHRTTQKQHRGMLGATGKHVFWRSKFRHARERFQDWSDWRSGNLTRDQYEQNKLNRKFDMSSATPTRMKRKGNKLDRMDSHLATKINKAEDKAEKRYEDRLEKLEELRQEQAEIHARQAQDAENETEELDV